VPESREEGIEATGVAILVSSKRVERDAHSDGYPCPWSPLWSPLCPAMAIHFLKIIPNMGVRIESVAWDKAIIRKTSCFQAEISIDAYIYGISGHSGCALRVLAAERHWSKTRLIIVPKCLSMRLSFVQVKLNCEPSIRFRRRCAF
jgi:hypothetical protein